jgi:hypothetical protein
MAKVWWKVVESSCSYMHYDAHIFFVLVWGLEFLLSWTIAFEGIGFFHIKFNNIDVALNWNWVDVQSE